MLVGMFQKEFSLKRTFAQIGLLVLACVFALALSGCGSSAAEDKGEGTGGDEGISSRIIVEVVAPADAGEIPEDAVVALDIKDTKTGDLVKTVEVPLNDDTEIPMPATGEFSIYVVATPELADGGALTAPTEPTNVMIRSMYMKPPVELEIPLTVAE